MQLHARLQEGLQEPNLDVDKEEVRGRRTAQRGLGRGGVSTGFVKPNTDVSTRPKRIMCVCLNSHMIPKNSHMMSMSSVNLQPTTRENILCMANPVDASPNLSP